MKSPESIPTEAEGKKIPEENNAKPKFTGSGYHTPEEATDEMKKSLEQDSWREN